MKSFKSIICGLLVAAMALPLAAQTETKESYQDKYNRMVQKSGAAGLGIETLLNKWLADYPGDADALLGKSLVNAIPILPHGSRLECVLGSGEDDDDDPHDGKDAETLQQDLKQALGLFLACRDIRHDL